MLCVMSDGPHRRVHQVLVGRFDQTDQDECRALCFVLVCAVWLFVFWW